MDDVIDIIKAAYKLYTKNYNRVLSAFIALFILSFLVAIVSTAINFTLALVEPQCQFPVGGDMFSSVVSQMVCDYTKPSSLIKMSLSWLSSIVVILVVLSVIKPMEEIALKKGVSEWTSHLGSQLTNAVKLFFFEFFVGLVTLLPILVVALVWVPGALSIASSASGEQLRGLVNDLIAQGILVFGVGFFFAFLLSTAFVLLFTFVRIELVLSNRGFMDAVRNSIDIFNRNRSKVFLFHFIWLLISFVLGILALLTCCLAFIVGPAISLFLVLPIRLFSEVLFWRHLTSPREVTVTPERVESSNIVY